jgi:hypothetical protein
MGLGPVLSLTSRPTFRGAYCLYQGEGDGPDDGVRPPLISGYTSTRLHDAINYTDRSSQERRFQVRELMCVGIRLYAADRGETKTQ